MARHILLFTLLLLGLMSAPAVAQPADVRTAWRLLDYLAVDYGGAVRGGKVTSASEYAEMREFSGSVADQLAALPASSAKGKLVADSRLLKNLIDQKAAPQLVSLTAHRLGSDLLSAYPVPLGPRQLPDLNRGGKLFQRDCASCHGANGDAKTAIARQLDPPPIAFVDRARASQRSPFALYQVINQGLEGTAMPGFAHLSDADKWALAFRASQFAYPEPMVEAGKRIWNAQPALQAKVPDLDSLSAMSERQLASDIGAGDAAAVIAYLRANPAAVASKTPTLAIARQRLGESLAAYRGGRTDDSKRLALSAYLDGVEPIEPLLSARSPALLASIEGAMGKFRASIARGDSPEQLEAQAAAVGAILDQIEQAIAPDQASDVSTFVGALTILLREGLEALLIVVAMLAFLRKADRPEMTRPVHYGWVGAILAGGLTWWAATRLIGISGASRELTEGFGSLLAAAVLLFVGIWMHGKSNADQWQRYIRTKLSKALSGRSGWFLFSLAFIAVYREIFETILFFTAMAADGSIAALVAGAVAGAVVLAIIAAAMLRFSQKLPIGKFFVYSSALVAVLATVLAGKGVAGLQEAGLVAVLPLEHWPRIPILGIFPTAQSVAAQLATLAALVAGFALNKASNRRLAAA